MTKRGVQLAAAWIGLQVLFFAGWAWREEARLRAGESILVRVVPVDPRDLLRGQYLVLGYEFSTVAAFPDAPPHVENGLPVWVELGKDGDFHVPRRLHVERPERAEDGNVVLLGRMDRWRIVFGIEKYFVPEGSETPAAKDLTVRLAVGGDGSARIERVLLRGQPWP